MNPAAGPTPRGDAVYLPPVLAVYDLWVLGISNRWIWKCPTRCLLEMYNRNVSDNHLEIGVGTGFFLDRCRFPSRAPRLVLLDANANCLRRTARRVAHYRPVVQQANVLEPLPVDPGFDSIGMNYVLHCLPGPMAAKAAALQHAAALLKPGGRLFGATILSGGVRSGPAAKCLMRLYNRLGIFSNRTDSLDALKDLLEHCLARSTVTVRGCVALFRGEKRD